MYLPKGKTKKKRRYNIMKKNTIWMVKALMAEELPEDALRIDIQRIDEDSREISITAFVYNGYGCQN